MECGADAQFHADFWCFFLKRAQRLVTTLNISAALYRISNVDCACLSGWIIRIAALYARIIVA